MAVVVQPGFYAQGEWKWRSADLLWDHGTDVVKKAGSSPGLSPGEE